MHWGDMRVVLSRCSRIGLSGLAARLRVYQRELMQLVDLGVLGAGRQAVQMFGV